MNKRTHIMLGRIIHQFAEAKLGIRLHRGSFVFGNVLPDIYFSFVTRPHTIDHTLEMVSKKIAKLMNMKQTDAYSSRDFSRRLGVICHYYADYFCYPHTNRYPGDLKDHVIYEKALCRYFLETYSAANAEALCGGRVALSSTEDAEKSLMRLQDEYNASNPSFDQDLRYSITVCTQAIMSITGAVYVKTPEDEDALELMPQTA